MRLALHRCAPLLTAPKSPCPGRDRWQLRRLCLLRRRDGVLPRSHAPCAECLRAFQFAGLAKWGVEGSEDPLEDEKPQRAAEYNPLFDKRTVLTVDAKGSKTPFQHELDRVASAARSPAWRTAPFNTGPGPSAEHDRRRAVEKGGHVRPNEVPRLD